ncbi:hypothetical protein IMX26_08260 [Clostridium sp. 'deep sea']|uniref:hypothetical protein n=1 Tax=Clostridium sp. 'deep sea' TaxID=2779445 RepID=UPI00189667E9|nr:hypothetical protein [Clostridium sp. 'deep sea']QOR36787.1 hypothetical protein IMX26_08260 [Clostridium sp. 'deep sea']
MKNYTEKVLNKTQEIVDKSHKMSSRSVETLTNPPKKIAVIGSSVGAILGVILVLMSVKWFYTKHSTWATSSLIMGVVTIISNIINLKKYNKI